ELADQRVTFRRQDRLLAVDEKIALLAGGEDHPTPLEAALAQKVDQTLALFLVHPRALLFFLRARAPFRSAGTTGGGGLRAPWLGAGGSLRAERWLAAAARWVAAAGAGRAGGRAGAGAGGGSGCTRAFGGSSRRAGRRTAGAGASAVATARGRRSGAPPLVSS